jgi:hypothetical protein
MMFNHQKQIHRKKRQKRPKVGRNRKRQQKWHFWRSPKVAEEAAEGISAGPRA